MGNMCHGQMGEGGSVYHEYLWSVYSMGIWGQCVPWTVEDSVYHGSKRVIYIMDIRCSVHPGYM